MKDDAHLSPVEWVKRVNHTWLVRGGLDAASEKWLAYLGQADPHRLGVACAVARAMCGLRDPLADPKPWFYAGLFSVATADEIRRFISGHRITMAAVPTMWRDPDVLLWLDRVGGETKDLIRDLRAGLERAGACGPVNPDA
jgi:hypothetical protein